MRNAHLSIVTSGLAVVFSAINDHFAPLAPETVNARAPVDLVRVRHSQPRSHIDGLINNVIDAVQRGTSLGSKKCVKIADHGLPDETRLRRRHNKVRKHYVHPSLDPGDAFAVGGGDCNLLWNHFFSWTEDHAGEKIASV